MFDAGRILMTEYSLVGVETNVGRIPANNNNNSSERIDISDKVRTDSSGSLLYQRVWAGGKPVDIPIGRIIGGESHRLI